MGKRAFPSAMLAILCPEMGATTSPGLVAYVRLLLFALWGISDTADPPPRVLIER